MNSAKYSFYLNGHQTILQGENNDYYEMYQLVHTNMSVCKQWRENKKGK